MLAHQGHKSKTICPEDESNAVLRHWDCPFKPLWHMNLLLIIPFIRILRQTFNQLRETLLYNKHLHYAAISPISSIPQNTPTAYYWPNIAACVSIWGAASKYSPTTTLCSLNSPSCCCTFRALTVTMCFHYCLNWTGSGFCDFLLSEFILFSLVGRTCYCRCFGVESYPASMCTLIEIHNRDITCSFSCRLMKCLLWNWLGELLHL